MRVLITGAGGQLGRELTEVFADHEVTAADHAELDVTARDQVLALVTSVRPDVIVHAAAYTNVEGAESDVDGAFAVNAVGTRNVAEGAERVGAYLCTFSTDYVFDGEKDGPYDEWDATNPLQVYGRSKLAAEREAMAVPASLVVRLSWVFGRYGKNFVKTVLQLANEREHLTIVGDQRGHPTCAGDAAAMVRRLVADRRTGIVHVTNQGEASWCEFARAVLAAAGLDPERVAPTTTAEQDPPRAATRPMNSVLDNAVLRLSGISLLPDFREPLGRIVDDLRRA